MARLEHWGVCTLKEKIDSMMFERTSIAKQSEVVIKREIQCLLWLERPFFYNYILSGTPMCLKSCATPRSVNKRELYENNPAYPVAVQRLIFVEFSRREAS